MQCDRQSPSCNQCSRAGVVCNYIKTSKRGFPEGYLAALEQRLCDTEIALFETLMLLRDPQNLPQSLSESPEVSTAFRQLNAEQSKSTRTDEWNRMPLHSYDQRRAWLEDKYRHIRSSQAITSASIPTSDDLWNSHRSPGESVLCCTDARGSLLSSQATSNNRLRERR
jgi:hypothetical protein